MVTCRNLVGGRFLEPTATALIASPWDGTPLGTAPLGGGIEMDAAIQAAEVAFDSWRLSSPGSRADLLFSIAAQVRKRRSELVALLTDEVGKPVTFSEGEVDRMEVTFKLAAELASKIEPEPVTVGYDPRGEGCSCTVSRRPIGPLLAITPYNWPFNLSAHKVAPALAGGNTVVLKPSPLAALSSLTLAELIEEAGCPPGVVNTVTCDPNNTQRGVQDPRIKHVSFTGSEAVGWLIKGLACEKRVTLELGGDAFVVVTSSAEINQAAEKIVTSAFGYAGQVCISAQHVLVEDSIYDSFREVLINATKDCPTGDPRLRSTVCGPMISETAVERVVSWIDEAVQGGGTVLAGGKHEGPLLWPTLVEKAPQTSRLGRDEVFGPVLTLDSYRNLGEAIQMIRASRFGIHTSVFSTDADIVRELEDNLEVSGIIVNDSPSLRFDNMPYGGEKRSGFGREGVRYSFEEMTRLQATVVRT